MIFIFFVNVFHQIWRNGERRLQNWKTAQKGALHNQQFQENHFGQTIYKKKKRNIATSLAVNEVELPRLGAYEEIFEQLGRFS